MVAQSSVLLVAVAVGSLAFADASGNSLHQVARHAVGQVPSATEIRPGQGLRPDEVRFGLFVKNAYNIDYAGGEFTVDMVQTSQWSDPRVISLVPPNSMNITLPTERAVELMWLPDIVVTNRAIKGSEVISSAVFADRNGIVSRVERRMATMKALFKVGSFPFDVQQLLIKVASSTYMANEVLLVPFEDTAFFGMREGCFKGKDFRLVNVSLSSFTEQDASLLKSRGVLNITIRRDSIKYIQTICVPSMLVLVLSWTVVYLPFVGHFTVPRVTTALVTTLCALNLQIKSASVVPSRSKAGICWIDLFQESCVVLNFMGLFCNTLVESAIYTFDKPHLAKNMNSELKYLLPCISVTIMIFLFLRTDPSELHSSKVICRTFLFLMLTGYSLWSIIRMYSKEDEEDDDEKGA
mmetsp:Transcript_33261/g.72593  ORF Transcript_33261/g.72593 Transcript_33261/m.72593 type:complete len:409 (-) Transcript_33261:132-1358(-)|eukprot:CAMPEP_0170595076 /NCGR_PEP_ID=MMETSP0224-20130122/14352_1 /TAXON_ID=285029 /ORGANISM="Togula jolla, Strain CCCM 725" /LENGTH=408 /DNA_ID=CAMNT_0010919199 /DNA_START=107 /DNA_END=1333 /DNA_ORIENTATION=-